MRLPGGFGRGMRFPGPRGGPGRMSRGVRRGGIGGIGLLIVLAIFLLFGGDFGGFLGGPARDPAPMGPSPIPTQQMPRAAGGDELADFVSVVLADTEDTWHALFGEMDRVYREPTLVLFSGQVRSACGFASAATGPFYCPGDSKVYVDLSFYRDLRDRLGAPGDFAQAYVIAHEIGHHVQNQLGILPKVDELRRRVGETQANQLSVMLELQADCLAGVWAHHADKARNILEAGDIEEGLGAASAIGDDRLQRQARGYVTPDSFTHGSSAQRVHWFRQGLETGELSACDTFNTAGF
jgi:predicted metalloprotease